jgi:hypothetical protein
MKSSAKVLATILGAVALVGLAGIETAQAGTSSASMSVNVTVQGRALLTVLSQPSSLVITDSDVRRGYVEVSDVTRVSVRTNCPNGYLVGFETTQGPFKTIEVRGLGTAAQIGPNGGWIPQSFTGMAPTTVDLSYRFILAENAMAGSYTWPVSLSATPR